MPTPMIAGLGPWEIGLIFAVIVLLFGAAKLPDLARNSGRALRIFKAETKGLVEGDKAGDDAGTTDGEQAREQQPETDRPASSD